MLGLGLGEAAELVYRAALADPNADLAGLARATDLGADEVTSAMAELVSAEFAYPDQSHPCGTRPVAPDTAVEIVLSRQQLDLAAQQLELERSRAAAAQFIASHSRSSSTVEGGGEVLTGLAQIRQRLAELADSAEESIWTFAPGGAHSQESIDASRTPNQRLLERGVLSRTVYLDSVRNDPLTSQHLASLVTLGAEVRTTPILPVRLIIIDERVAVLPMDATNAEEGAVILRGSGTVAALVALFGSVWESAVPVGSTPPEDDDELSPQDRAILKLLADGRTDDYVGARLGVSARTARRLTSDIMKRLDARSRFQAGILAERRGWFTHRP